MRLGDALFDVGVNYPLIYTAISLCYGALNMNIIFRFQLV